MSSVKIPLLVLFKFKFWRMHPILNVPNFYEQWTTRTRTLFFLNAVTKNLTKHLKRWQKGPCFFYFIEKPFNSNCWLKGNEIYEKWSLPSNCFLLVSIWMATTRLCESRQIYHLFNSGAGFVLFLCEVFVSLLDHGMFQEETPFRVILGLRSMNHDFFGSHDFDMIIGNIMQLSKFRLSRLEQ